MSVVFGLVGKSGFGREVMPLALDSVASKYPGTRVMFLDTDVGDGAIGELSVLTEDQFLALEDCEKIFNVAVADSRIRQKIAEKLIAAGCTPASIQASNATFLDRIDIGMGSIICTNSHITSDVSIGKFFHCNIYSYVAHDSKIGDFVTFAPRVSCNGNVVIEDHAYVGTGAVLKQGQPGNPLVIGEGAIVGMGAVVTKNVAAFTTVVGNPARPLRG